MSPYLLPLDHPAKPILDLIFSETRVIENKQSLLDAEFKIISVQYGSSIIVAKHPLVPGFIFKIYCDSESIGRKGIPGWECLTQRCINAKKTRKIINRNSLRYFTAPEKWLYILPLNSNTPKKNKHPVILIATDMELVPREATKLAWKTTITPSHLDELYIIFEAGYGSSYLINNIPYTKHDTFALVDLEKPKRKINMKRITKYLSKEMRHYWEELLD